MLLGSTCEDNFPDEYSHWIASGYNCTMIATYNWCDLSWTGIFGGARTEYARDDCRRSCGNCGKYN